MINLSIIIVNWNANTQLLDCLSSLTVLNSFQEKLKFKVIVVDNASQDQSLFLIRQPPFPFPLHIVQNSQNVGFGKACNQAALDCKESDYFLFLNPDTRLFEQNYSLLFDLFEQNPKLGVLGIQLLDDQNRVTRTCARFPSFKVFLYESLGLDQLLPQRCPGRHRREWDHKNSQNVDHVIGAFYLMKAKLFFELKGFDENFFMYLEDLDLSYRVHQAGFKSYFSAEFQAFHKGGGTSAQIKDIRLFYALKSKLVYMHKHFTKPAYLASCILTLVIEPLTRMSYALMKGHFKDFIHTIKAYGLLYKDVLKTFLKCKFRPSLKKT